MRVLITGFEPFGGETINPSWEVARALHDATIGGGQVRALQLPCRFGAAGAQLAGALQHTAFDVVIALGQAGGRPDVSVERIAINVDDAPIADNGGDQPLDRAVVAGAPAAYFSSLPIKRIVAAVRAAGVPASVSQTAGTFVCNHLFYHLAHLLATRYPGVRGGFIHLPMLPAQAAAHPGAPCLALETLVTGIRAAIEATISTDNDLALGSGALN